MIYALLTPKAGNTVGRPETGRRAYLRSLAGRQLRWKTVFRKRGRGRSGPWRRPAAFPMA